MAAHNCRPQALHAYGVHMHAGKRMQLYQWLETQWDKKNEKQTDKQKKPVYE